MTARRWRPSLAFVLGGALAATLAMSLAGLVVLRYLGAEIGFRPAAMLVAAVIAAATGALGWLLVRLLLRPIRALEAFALAEGAADRPRHHGTRELHATAQRVIAMADALRDREATVRAFTDHVTHELKTPVAGIRAGVELMQDGGSLTAEDARLLDQIDSARLQIETQLAALRRVAQAREVRYLGETTVQRALDLVLGQVHIAVHHTGDTAILPLSSDGLAVVLLHLLNNAAAMGAQNVTLSQTETGLLVCDDGPGISDGNAARVFDPFFTTRRDSGGTGMGLTIARTILQAHGGDIHLVPRASGTCFRICFP
ncbi:signal transduction histidine kinase [Sagittula marina]|uniref:histidine kinase n=1 Tax=Sagittula marina TaxID=943940 RepID=A0A7W6DNU6_9RHOB|nr:HAMP domain-containing sensor histidine kinase [Sagittula marina]MBB3986556.1 signal transduction histidine kinase [Sagittula marina]